jgi:prepilin-type processing-associated H-X9-DG protein
MASYELGNGSCSLASIRALIVTFADGHVIELPTSDWVDAVGQPL